MDKMDSEIVIASQIQPLQTQRTRFYFGLEKDIILLKEVLNCNPYQLGGEKWNNIVKNLKDYHNWNISVRTAKERVANLLAKLQKEDLTSRTGSEEQNSERKQLLYEIQMLKEETVAEFVGSSASATRKEELLQANKERENIVQEKYGGDSPISEMSMRRRKLPKTEEEIFLKKQVMDHELEQKRLQYEHEEKMRQLEVENTKIIRENEYRLKSLEVERQRLEMEQANKEVLATVLRTMGAIYQKLTENKQ